ncbi:MAG: TonB-dependent receptor [Planctomycetota bacterium]
MRRLLLLSSLFLAGWIFVLGNSVAFSETEPITPTKTEEIIITATRTKQEVKDISGNATVISSQEIKESNAHSVGEIIKYQSGIDIQSGNFFGSKIRLDMRGLPGNYGAQRVLVMMDGRPINEEYMGDVDFRFISIDNIERIEIVRGPASALYGSNAIGGVINLITKSGQDKPMINLKSTVGSFNTYGTNLQHGKQLGSFDYFITADDQKTDGYLKNTDGTSQNRTSQNVSARTRWKLNDKSLVELSLGTNDGEGREANFIRDQSTNYINLGYKTNWSPARPFGRSGGKEHQADFSARIYRNGLNQRLKWTSAPVGTYDQYTIGAQLQQSMRLSNHLFTVGVDAKKEDVLVKDNGLINQTINSEAVYVQDEIAGSKKSGVNALITTIGLRYDRNEEFGSETSPRAGVVYHFSERTSIRSAVGKGYRAPTVSDLFLPTTSYGPMTFQGNPNLKPETLWSYELGIDHNFSAGGGSASGGNDGISSRLTIFQSSLENAWDYMKDPDNVYRPHNVTKMLINGVEAETNYRIIKGLEGFINYTYNDAKYKSDENNPAIKDNYVEEIPRFQSSLGLRFQPDNSNTIINLKIKGTGNRYTDPENTGQNKLAKHLVTDIGISTDMNKNSSFFISAHNLFNRVYKEVIEYYEPERWFETGLSIKF